MDSKVIVKSMNLEKNLPLVILEVELNFEILNVVYDLNSKGESLQPFKFLFHESSQRVIRSDNFNVDTFHTKMNDLSIKDQYGEHFNLNFKQNQYLGNSNFLYIYIYIYI